MTPVLSSVTITSDNLFYPQNKVTATVDNDLNLNTVVVPNTSFPYIIKFINCPNAVDKRYISDKFYKRLTNPINGVYNTDRGRIFSNLRENVGIYPYLILDFEIFQNTLKSIQNKKIQTRDGEVFELDYYGASIENFINLSPEFLLKWLDISLIDKDGNPISKFPILLNYSNKTNLDINIKLIKRKKLDFFATEYYVEINYPTDDSVSTEKENDYENYSAKSNTEYKESKFSRIRETSKKKTLNSILESASKITTSVLGVASLLSSIKGLKDKLNQPLPPKPSPPQKPTINFSERLVKRKVKKAEQKERKKRRLSNRKLKPEQSLVDDKTPSIENLKSKSGNLKNIAQSAKSAALVKATQIADKVTASALTTVSYVITTTVEGDTIFVNVANNFGKPPITITFSAITYTPDLAKSAIQFDLDNFGITSKDFVFYPKTGSPKPS